MSNSGVEGGSLTLNDRSAIRGNTTKDVGGGMWNAGSLTLNDHSAISGNTASKNGGGLFDISRSSELVGVACGPLGNVRDNTPDDCFTVAP